MYDFLPSLGSDNHSGVHPRILESLFQANRSHAPSYGTDLLTKACLQEFKNHFGPHALTYFVFNGTAANVSCLNLLTKSYESLLCSEQAHLHLDECGAPEKHIGCKVIPLSSRDGKIYPDQIASQLRRLGDQHHSQPRVVSITQPTELGVVYSLDELRALRDFTKDNGLFLHMDGARLANAAYSLQTDLGTLTYKLGLDALSFGGTKNGLLGAEAVVIWNEELARNLKFYRKQFMQLPSKMRFLSAQFLAYLQNDLWREIAGHSCKRAQELFLGLKDVSEIKIPFPVQSNAVFAKIPKAWISPLRKEMFFYIWDETQSLCRWMTSFDTTSEDIQNFLNRIEILRKG